MKRSLVFASAVLLSLALVPSASAQSPAPFIGLWEGIDPVDGANSQHSIACSGSGTEATCDVTITFSSLIFRGGCPTVGPAHAVGHDGVLEGDDLHFVFVVATCRGGFEPDLEMIYEHDLSNDTLVAEIITNGGGIPVRSFHIHKISE